MNILSPTSYYQMAKSVRDAIQTGNYSLLSEQFVNPFPIEDIYNVQWQNAGQWTMMFTMFPHITVYVESVSIPNYTFNTHEQTKAITGFKFLGDITITFKEDGLGTVQQFLGILESLIWDRKTKIFRDNQRLALQSAVVSMDEFHPMMPTLMWRFSGLKYKGMADHNLTGWKGDKFPITTTWSVKQVYPMYLLNGFGTLPI